MRVFDIVQPRDEWERGYAHIEYLRTGILNKLSRKIEVEYV